MSSCRKYEHLDYINYDDRIIVNGNRKFRMSCEQCGGDRGYQRTCDRDHPCVKCSIKKRTKYTLTQRKIRSSVKSSINGRLRRRSNGLVTTGAFRYLDFSFNELITHLENNFSEGMNWDNYGGIDGWEIDHSKPDSWFCYESVNDQGFKDSWSLGNLKPMWAKENRSKGSRYETI